MASLNTLGTVANIHFYPPSQCDIGDGSTRGGAMNDVSAGFAAMFPGMPQMISEWHPTLYLSNVSLRLNATYDAYYTACFFLSAFRAGFIGWYWYALEDYGTTFLSGLFPQTGGVAPRAAAYTIQAMYQLTGDHGDAKHAFTPGKLNVSFTGLPSPISGAANTGGQTMLFQATDGRFFQYVWNAQATPGGTPVTVTMTSSSTLTNVRVFQVSDATSPSAPMTALQDIEHSTTTRPRSASRLKCICS